LVSLFNPHCALLSESIARKPANFNQSAAGPFLVAGAF